MAKISLYHDDRYQIDGRGELKIRIFSEKVTTYISTDLRMLASEWEEIKSGRGYNRSLISDVERLKDIIVKVSSYIVRTDYPTNSDYILSLKDEFTRQMLKQEGKFDVRPVKAKENYLMLNRMRQLRDEHQKKGTWELYDRTIKAILAFDPLAENKSFEQFDYAWLKEFEAHCKQTMKVNSISILMRNIRATFNVAIADDITDAYPFKKYKIKNEETRKRSISLEDLRNLATMPVETWHEEYRDMFFLSFMLIGINMSDMLSLKPTDLKDGRIEYDRMKTGTFYNIKVEPEALALINKYRGKDHLLAPLDRYRNAKDYIEKMNKALKQIGRKTGKKGKVLTEGKYPFLSTYWARHSWATLAYMCDIPIDTIAQALGHKNREHRITMVYIRQDTKKVDKANRKVIDMLTGVA